ncbi:PREDICTED: nucleoplasmin-like protein ANO39 [Rhagoletis zephyria]|uniref:nucleoplasmin-like protein ANO39 n=1 Tax=Rhagoletis zephyria TaxID=28612 RepID=UPI0008112398|nr:PREDICTED: nucleoplasmin-like protein ANO39 [Rhagoletis zephyria]
MNEEQIRLLLEEENSTSDYEDENDSDVEDFVAGDVESYDTEQEDDEECDEELNEIDDREFYLGKDGHTRWNKDAPSNRVLFNIIMNEEQIRLLLEEENSTSDYEDENDSDVEDFVAGDVESYDTEQEDDEECDEELNEIDDREFYLDAKMFYTSKMEVYVRKQPSGPYEVDNSSMELVVRLSENLDTQVVIRKMNQ